MNQEKIISDFYTEDLSSIYHEQRQGKNAQAFASFVKESLPKSRSELWKFHNFAFLRKQRYILAEKANASSLKNEIEKRKLNPFSKQLVFINGYYSEESSSHLPIVANKLDDMEDLESFSALNFALSPEKWHLDLALSKDPWVLEIFHINTLNKDTKRATTFTNLSINVGDKQNVYLYEHHISLAAGASFLRNYALTIALGKKAKLCHLLMQKTNSNEQCFCDYIYKQAEDSCVQALSLNHGGEYALLQIKAELKKGAKNFLSGLAFAQAKSSKAFKVAVKHLEADAESSQFFKIVASDSAHGIFTGSIDVLKDAQKTKAKQLCKSLLIGKNARVSMQPILQIKADDVRCAHGATVAKLREEDLFYLRSRGINLESAKNLLTRAFINELIFQITDENLRKYAEKIWQDLFEDENARSS